MVCHHKGTLHLAQMGYGILCEDGKAVGGNELRNAMVDLRVHVIGTSCQDNAPLSVILHPLEGLLPFLFHILPGGDQLLPCGMGSHLHLSSRDLEGFCKFLYKGICQDGLVGKCHEGVHEMHMLLLQSLYIVLDIFCVGCHHGAVVMVACCRAFVALIGNAGVEDKLHALADQPGHMAVDQLCRIALRFAGNGLNTQLVDLPGGLGREHHMVAQLLKENSPEGEVFIHVEYPRDAYGAPVSLI